MLLHQLGVDIGIRGKGWRRHEDNEEGRYRTGPSTCSLLRTQPSEDGNACLPEPPPIGLLLGDTTSVDSLSHRNENTALQGVWLRRPSGPSSVGHLSLHTPSGGTPPALLSTGSSETDLHPTYTFCAVLCAPLSMCLPSRSLLSPMPPLAAPLAPPSKMPHL